MRAVVTFTVIMALFTLMPDSFAADDHYQQIVGSFQGEVFNGYDLDPVTTTFILDATGHLRGEYFVDEENGAFKGSLSNILFEDERTITLEWTDKFGEGFAVMEFSSDYRSFTGEWSDNDGSSPLPWSGKKSGL